MCCFAFWNWRVTSNVWNKSLVGLRIESLERLLLIFLAGGKVLCGMEEEEEMDVGGACYVVLQLYMCLVAFYGGGAVRSLVFT